MIYLLSNDFKSSGLTWKLLIDVVINKPHKWLVLKIDIHIWKESWNHLTVWKQLISGLFKMLPMNCLLTNYVYIYIYIRVCVCVCVCKRNLRLDYPQGWEFHKTQPTKLFLLPGYFKFRVKFPGVFWGVGVVSGVSFFYKYIWIVIVTL